MSRRRSAAGRAVVSIAGSLAPVACACSVGFNFKSNFNFNFNFKVNFGFASRFALAGELLLSIATKVTKNALYRRQRCWVLAGREGWFGVRLGSSPCL